MHYISIKKFIISLLVLCTICILTIYYISENQAIALVSENDTNKLYAQVNYEIYDSVDYMEEKADAVIIVKTTGELENINNVKPNKDPMLAHNPFNGYTKTQVNVKEILKLDNSTPEIKKGEDIYVIEPNFFNEKTEVLWEGYINMSKNKKYILFLKWSDTKELYEVSGLHQGKYNIDGTDEKEKEISEKNEMYDDLKKQVKYKYKDKIRDTMLIFLNQCFN